MAQQKIQWRDKLEQVITQPAEGERDMINDLYELGRELECHRHSERDAEVVKSALIYIQSLRDHLAEKEEQLLSIRKDTIEECARDARKSIKGFYAAAYVDDLDSAIDKLTAAMSGAQPSGSSERDALIDALQPFANAFDKIAEKKKAIKESFTVQDRMSLYCGGVSVALDVKDFSNAKSALKSPSPTNKTGERG